jgi:hypothetical protein
MSLNCLTHSTCVNLYLSTNLISALASLNVYNFPHFYLRNSTSNYFNQTELIPRCVSTRTFKATENSRPSTTLLTVLKLWKRPEPTPLQYPNWSIFNCRSDAIQRSQASKKVTSLRGNRDTLLQTSTQVLFFFRFAISLFSYRTLLVRLYFLPIHGIVSGKAWKNENSKKNINSVLLHGDRFTNQSQRQHLLIQSARVWVTLRLAVCSKSVRLCAKPLENHDQRLFFYWTLAVIVLMQHPLWREDGSVVYNCCWA